ncbi:hypothetical protein [Chryseobacterium flavum]|uniref:hypothetical protein n=1 Tax=Chryseobacterium flavum TaxID=415851 RepID=UPI0028A7FE4C|nr:hypothetical protein [Chryseobacterium flavum]
MDFLQWLQHALMEHLDDLQLMVQLWLDRRSLRHSCLANTKKSKHTGGALKNQSVTEDLTLPPGQYTLHYKSDSGHAYNHWDSLPPDDYFWGIRVLDISSIN